jgi:hypothetical protein
VRDFCKRYGLSLHRNAAGAEPWHLIESIQKFYENLKRTLGKKTVKTTQKIYVDETGFSAVPLIISGNLFLVTRNNLHFRKQSTTGVVARNMKSL